MDNEKQMLLRGIKCNLGDPSKKFDDCIGCKYHMQISHYCWMCDKLEILKDLERILNGDKKNEVSQMQQC